MTAEVRVDLRGLDEMQAELEHIRSRAVHYAARETLNGLAFAGRKIWQAEIASSFTLRNTFTTRRVLVAKATGAKMADMESSLGHTEDYMRRLEYGIGEQARGSGVPIPTETAAGQAQGSLPGGRKRAVRKAFYLRGLGKIRRQPQSLSRKQRNARAIAQGIKNGTKLAFLEIGRRRGIFRVVRGRRPMKLYDVTHHSVPLPRVPTLQRTITKALLVAPGLALTALTRQLERARGAR